MPRTSGLIPSRTTASKHSTDQHQSLERLFQFGSKRNPKFKNKSLRIYLTNIKVWNAFFNIAPKGTLSLKKKFVNLFDQN